MEDQQRAGRCRWRAHTPANFCRVRVRFLVRPERFWVPAYHENTAGATRCWFTRYSGMPDLIDALAADSEPPDYSSNAMAALH